MTIVNAIAKWHSDGEGIRKREPRGRNLKGRGGTAPSLPLGVSRDTGTKLINSDSVSEKLTLELAVNQIELPQSFFDCK